MDGPDLRRDKVTIAAASAATLSLAVAVGAALMSSRSGSEQDSPSRSTAVIQGPMMQEVLPALAGVPEGYTSPTGPDRGPTSVEWDAIRVYKVIETMTADSPPVPDVDRALERLRRFTADHPENPFMHSTYLKGLRGAIYYADRGADPERFYALHEEFTRFATRWRHYEPVVIETMWYGVDRLARQCTDPAGEIAELERLRGRVPESDKGLYALLQGIGEALQPRCGLSAEESAFWNGRRLELALANLESLHARWSAKSAWNRMFHTAFQAGDLIGAEAVVRGAEPVVLRYPDDLAGTYTGWLIRLERSHREASQRVPAEALRAELLELGRRLPSNDEVQRHLSGM